MHSAVLSWYLSLNGLFKFNLPHVSLPRLPRRETAAHPEKSHPAGEGFSGPNLQTGSLDTQKIGKN
jgi:hypothetical protein